ncbi:hypothetical protein OCG22_002475 [Citrobacter freundii]|uniref:hypothetical protein n=1 Tax=Citrobacter freundii TaxID=546 RepID=UPI001F251B28|nr:hypothetical protein [Citrobacter freundii]MDU5712493.1 hypothetical protein [Citrobacter freundii]MDU5728417.1 hypothetical protein [Citrobacter freundii]MDU5795158.1 hypothetical protein [Citrobacter freundii]
MQTINNRMTETQIADLFSLAVQLQVKAEESNDRDTAIFAYSIQNACSNLTESRREFWAADATINNLELKITDMTLQLANAESKCRELAAENSALKLAAKKVIKMNRQHAKDQSGDPDIAESWGCVKVLRKAKSVTPATDAFLAEVRAQGVEMFALQQSQIAAEQEQSGDYEFSRHCSISATEACEFAEELREGKCCEVQS